MSAPSPRVEKLIRLATILAVVSAFVSIVIGSWRAVQVPQGFVYGPPDLNGSLDLLQRHNECRLILMGENPYRLAREKKLKARLEELFGPRMPADPDYFPSTLLPVVCLTWLPFSAVQVVWLLLSLTSIVMLMTTVRWMMEPWLPRERTQVLMLGLWACGVPVWSCLAMGQATLFSLAFTLAAFRADVRGRWLFAGVLLAFGVFKYPVIWPFVLFFFILQMRWRCLLVSGGIHAVVHLVLCHLMKADPVRIFAEVLGGNAKVFHANRTLTFSTPFRAWNSWFPDLAVPDVCGVLLLALIVIGLACLWLRRERNSREGLLVWTGALALLAVMTVASRAYAHMYPLPLLLVAAMPSSDHLTLTRFERLRIGWCCLYLNGAASGVDPLGFSPAFMLALLYIYNFHMALLAFDVARLLLRWKLVTPPRPA